MKVRAKSTIHGTYGLINEGETKSIEAHLAKELELAGLVEILDETTPAEELPKGKDMTNVRKGKTDGK